MNKKKSLIPNMSSGGCRGIPEQTVERRGSLVFCVCKSSEAERERLKPLERNERVCEGCSDIRDDSNSKSGLKFIVLLFFLAAVITGSIIQDTAFCHSGRQLRIVSLSPVITEGLYLLGVEDSIIGVTIYCQKPVQAKDKQKVGTVMDVNVEKIISLKPDVVFAMSHTNAKDIKKLRDTGVDVIAFDIPKTFERLCEIFLALGKTVGKEKEAINIVNASVRKVSDIREKTSRLKKQKVFIQIGAKPLFAATDDSFVNDYIEFAGGINIFKDAGLGLISREEVLKRNPDVILIATMGISGEDEMKIWKRYKTINAVKKNRIHIVDPDRICSPTPVSFAGYLSADIVEKIHPGTLK